MVQNGISPLPKLLRLLVHHQVGLFHSDSTACHDEFAHLPRILLHFCRQEERCRCSRIRVHSRPLRDVNHAVSHEKSLKVHRGSCDGELW